MSVGTAAAIGLGISGATSLVGGILGSNAASDAAGQQEKALEKVIAEWQQIQSQNTGALSPYTSAGSTILPQLLAMTQKGFQAPTSVNYQNDPGYQFRMQQGQQALEQSAAASGGALGGGELKALTQYGQNFGSNEYQNVYNRALTGYQTNLGGLQYLSGLGLNATGMGVNSNIAAGQSIGGALSGIGNAAAAGTVGSANAWSGALGGLGNNLGLLGILSQLTNRGSGGGAGGGPPQGPPLPPGYQIPTGLSEQFGDPAQFSGLE